MEMVRDIVAWTLILGGGFFLIVGSFGLIRLPDVYARVHSADSEPRPSIEVDGSGRQLRIIATNRQMPKIEELVAKLDTIAKPPQLEMKLVEVKDVDLQRLATDLEETHGRLHPPEPNRPKPSITADVINGQLRLLGTPEQIGQIEKLIPTLSPAASLSTIGVAPDSLTSVTLIV